MWSQQTSHGVADVDLNWIVLAQAGGVVSYDDGRSFMERLQAVTAKSIDLLLLLADLTPTRHPVAISPQEKYCWLSFPAKVQENHFIWDDAICCTTARPLEDCNRTQASPEFTFARPRSSMAVGPVSKQQDQGHSCNERRCVGEC